MPEASKNADYTRNSQKNKEKCAARQVRRRLVNMERSFRFAIMGAGKIAVQFCDAVRRIEGAEVAAVSSKSMERAENFAKEQGIPAFYDSYEEMLKKEKPDCVYIATLPNTHYELSMLCLNYCTPVLCEKAAYMNSAQAWTVFRRADELGVFVMEALWSRYLPAINQAARWLAEGRIGETKYSRFEIAFCPEKDPKNRYFNPDLGGGAATDITVYAYELTTWLLGSSYVDLRVDGQWGETGVDETDVIYLRYPGFPAICMTSFATSLDASMEICGDKGRIVLPNAHCAREAILYGPDRKPAEHFKDTETDNGFVYEIKDVMNCIRAGKTESATVPHSATLDCAKVFDMIYDTKKRR